MKRFIFLFLIVCAAAPLYAQSAAEKIYATERAFEIMAADKGINAAFIEFMAPDGIMFFPEAENAREKWKLRPPSPAYLTWNPILIDVSANEVLGYSIGNSLYRANGKNDSAAYAGHYISVWLRRPDGSYRAVFDTGINHPTPATAPTEWRRPPIAGEGNPKNISAADSSTGFYQTVPESAAKAYSRYLADDAVLMREGIEPARGKRAAMDLLKRAKGTLAFAKRKSFFEAADLAYVHSGYSVADRAGKEIERGNFMQVWKLLGGRWQIVADVQVPVTKASK